MFQFHILFQEEQFKVIHILLQVSIHTLVYMIFVLPNEIFLCS